MFLRTILIACLLLPFTAPAQEASGYHAAVSLAAEQDAIVPGKPFTVAVIIEHELLWHTYWRDPGATGKPTTVTWKLPEGFTAAPLQWPAPHATPSDDGVVNLLEGRALLLSEITPPAVTKNGDTVNIEATVKYLVCNDEAGCFPGSGIVSLTLPVKETAVKDPAQTAAFDEVRKVQDSLPAVPVRSSTPPVVAPTPASVLPAENQNELIATIRGWGVRTLDGEKSETLTWPVALLFAFLGGIILNLMPCVFPVLGIKILGFVRQSGEDHGAVKKHGLVYAAGIFASMMVLVGVLLALRAFGDLLGWGFQLQNPVFLMCLIVLVFAVSLELAGVFEMGTSLTSVGAELQDKSGYKGSFFSGLLTVLLATPCTGPFMGPALGFALSKTTPVGLVIGIFVVLAAGLAFPYVLLSWYPALVKKLPRPGAWMETFKQVMSFPMFATCGWLITVFVASTGDSGLFYALMALVFVAMTLWLYGRFGTLTAKPRSKKVAMSLAVLFLLTGGGMAWHATRQVAPPAALKDNALAYSPQLIIERRAQGLTTVVDFWARWCVLCESNKKLAFTRKEFLDSLKGHNAAFMLADWTAEDPDIGKFLAAYDQGGIPFALVIPPTGPAIQLPAALASPADAIRGLEEAKQQAAAAGAP